MDSSCCFFFTKMGIQLSIENEGLVMLDLVWSNVIPLTKRIIRN